MRTVIVCGSRNGARTADVTVGMEELRKLADFDHVCVGIYRGAGVGPSDLSVDERVFMWCMRNEIACTAMPAQWRTGEHAKAGRVGAEGPMRNQRMIDSFANTLVAGAAFEGGRGTADMTRRLVAFEGGTLPVYQRADGAWRLVER